MSRKAIISKEALVEAAFNFTLREGIDSLTSRALAAEAGCSTQPIFRLYENMDALKSDVYAKAAGFYETYYGEYEKKSNVPFVDLGMAYIGFARKYPKLFYVLFMKEKAQGARSMYDIVNGSSDAVQKEIARAKNLGCSDANRLFMQMWIFIHGAAAMAVTGDNDLDDTQLETLLEACYKDFSS